MPWHIESNRADCAGFAVVKDEDGELEGCHRNREQAERQLAALYASESDDNEDDSESVNDDENLANQVGIRAGQGELAIITDIDGTLRLESGPNVDLVNYLNESDAEIIVITGRNESQRQATAAYLDSIGLDWELLEMSSGGNPATFKRRTAERLLARYEIREAFENDAAARDAYNSLGINAKTPQARTMTAKAILAHVRRRALH